MRPTNAPFARGCMQTSLCVSLRPHTGASHFFTAASDPRSTCYKRFAFGKQVEAAEAVGAAEAAEAQCSLELWQRWRTIDLRGGLKSAAASDAAASRLVEGLQRLEANAMSAAAAAADPAAGVQIGGSTSFAAAIERELELLAEAVPSCVSV
mmetsp:Transcript_19470/g.39786  ORF Transcript_19470/g.39786 Transcript_19470/m.39786 type:complete len:152 (-) Transcript_19470:216-671(-)